jgi:DNA polymerase III delta prime subunit
MFAHDRTTHYLWVEKYRPSELENYIGNEQLKKKFAQYIADNDPPHLLLVGPAGTGKTTAAKILLQHIECDTLVLNASDDNNIETVRSKIRGFASTMSLTGLKLILLDEFDGFTRQGQEALRNLMEKYSMNVRFILTANHIERVIEPIVSRVQTFKILPPSKVDTAKHVYHILKKENVEFTMPDLKIILDAYFPDIRKILGECQSATHNGKLAIDAQQMVENDVKLKIIDILKNDLTYDKKLSTLRQLIADTGLREFSDIYRILFDRVDEYAPKNISLAIGAIAKGQFQDVQVVDKEINMINTFIDLLQVIK